MALILLGFVAVFCLILPLYQRFDGKALEWDKQADAFMATAKGKTLDEVKAYMGEDKYAIGDLAAAGCTINIADLVKAAQKAISK